MRPKSEIIEVIAQHNHAAMTILNQLPHELAGYFPDRETAESVRKVASERIKAVSNAIKAAIQKVKSNRMANAEKDGDARRHAEEEDAEEET